MVTHTWVLQDNKATHTPPPGALSAIDSQSFPFLFLRSTPKRPAEGNKLLLVAQARSTVLAEHFCVKSPENRRGRCSLASLALTSAVSHSVPSVSQPHGTTAWLSVAKFAPTTEVSRAYTQTLDPRRPHKSLIPTLGPPSPRLPAPHLVWRVGTPLRGPGAYDSAAAF